MRCSPNRAIFPGILCLYENTASMLALQIQAVPDSAWSEQSPAQVAQFALNSETDKHLPLFWSGSDAIPHYAI